MANKGSPFERWVAKRLSLWWTDGADDNCFWRTHGSGGRATSRTKKNLTTRGHYGDLCALDGVGAPLIRLVTWELKRGYSRSSVADLLDKAPRHKEQAYEGFFAKAVRDHKAAGSFAWAVVVKRDQREPLLFIPGYLADRLHLGRGIVPSMMFYGWLGTDKEHAYYGRVYGCPLEGFLKGVTPRYVTELGKVVFDERPKTFPNVGLRECP